MDTGAAVPAEARPATDGAPYLDFDLFAEWGVRALVTTRAAGSFVSGPTRLRGSTVESPDIRAGMAMLLAAMCAEGRSTINNVGQIERGYERIDERLNALGANIERIEDRREDPAPGRRAEAR